MKVLVTGAAGNGGQAVCRALIQAGYSVRMADVMPPSADDLSEIEFVRCDTRSPGDVRTAVNGMDAVVHLAAWHCAHNPPVSDETIFAVNVDGTFHVLEACRQAGIQSIVYASSMAYGWWSVYGVSKVIGEDLCKTYHEMTGASIAMLRYHEFIPRPYLEFGARLLRNGVDRRDVAEATVASVKAVLEKRVGLFRTIVHTNHGMPIDVIQDFKTYGPAWCEKQVPGAIDLLNKYEIELPEQVEQHDLSEAEKAIGWKPRYGFLEFLKDLKARDEKGIDVTHLKVPSEIPAM
ncbi:NAD-dependent epimerase/dehydratase family protein [Paenibacillus andongensis]|uniref:NAD-dependent epimerase/dehydratase family protein n=1 Tax=Paenibacillus andongensis TaxID=2975482 RepID=UPI0021BB8460|nr:NAD(P)-dependent oxidoreductase [Paenibacillus andongensis]